LFAQPLRIGSDHRQNLFRVHRLRRRWQQLFAPECLDKVCRIEGRASNVRLHLLHGADVERGERPTNTGEDNRSDKPEL